MKNKPYREVLGSIMYAQIGTRPNLSYSVSTLSRFNSDPGPKHWHALMHVLQYIKGTLQFKVVFGGEGYRSITPYRYIDSDFAGDTDTCRSCARHVFIQSGGPTAWGSQYQPTVALSTTEAEYMLLTQSARQIQWMYSAMSEVGFLQPKPGQLIGDNSGSISLMKNTKQNSCIKHIDIQYHYIWECIEDGDITVEYVLMTDNLVDLLTKPLGRAAHH